MPAVDMSNVFQKFDGEKLLEKLKELDTENKYLEKSVRLVREQMLVQSDWTQAADAPLSPEVIEAYRVYRQKLRDLPNHPDFPNVELPKV
jgi:hypothetical protein